MAAILKSIFEIFSNVLFHVALATGHDDIAQYRIEKRAIFLQFTAFVSIEIMKAIND